MAKGSARAADTYVLSLLRIVSGLLIACHGLQKTFGALGGHRAPLFSLAGAAGWIELVCGALVALGLFTRPAAFLLSGEMAVAYFKTHFPNGPVPVRNGGELAVIYCFVFLFITFAGPGALSADRLLRGRV